MKARFSAIVAVIALPFAGTSAHASSCAIDEYLHNGSIMEVQVCDGGPITISYAQPRPGIAEQGARPGTLLFDGTEHANGAITGRSRLFSARCGVVTYSVSGHRQGDTIILNGTAPVRGKDCGVARYRDDNLVFTLGGGPQIVPGDCPPGYVRSGSQCIVIGGGPTPRPAPPEHTGGDWYAIAGSFRSQHQAQARASQLGHPWRVLHTSQCPNMTPGYWIAAAGGYDRGQAQGYASVAKRYGGYAKSCH